MSIKLMTQAWSLSTTNHTQKLILLKLADNASDEGVCWPSMNTIATQCQCSRRTVLSHINKLANLGWLKISNRYKSDGSKNSNMYQLTLPDVVKEDHIGGESVAHGVVKDVRIGGERGAHKPSLNHQLEPSVKTLCLNEVVDQYFEKLWRSYPTKANKKKAKLTFLYYIKKKKLDINHFTEQLMFDIDKRCESKQFGFDKLHFTSYINGDRWQDDYPINDLSMAPKFDFNKLKF